MLESLHLKNVGPAPEMKLSLAPRLNLITGDNGLGKSFLLDVAWWALTRKWPRDLNGNLTSGYAARPTVVRDPASITFEVRGKTGSVSYASLYDRLEQTWGGKAGRPWNPGLVVYALADGGFAVWDPARNYWRRRGGIDVQERVSAYVFSHNDLWDGLRVSIGDSPTLVCNGLIADWASWIRERSADATRMAEVLAVLGPSGGAMPLAPGPEFARLSVNDARDIPTVRMGYGQDVAILYASLAVRRIAALAYVLSWAWREHQIAAKQLGEPNSSRIVLLFDEIEAHLHPRWQRAIVPAILEVVQTLTQNASATVQLIAATHSPLVLASMEPLFDSEKDAWFDLDLEGQVVLLRRREFIRRGEVGNWLTSEAFDLGSARSVDAERAIGEALAILRAPAPDPAAIKAVDRKLRNAGLSDIDPFWVRWSKFVEDSSPSGGAR